VIQIEQIDTRKRSDVIRFFKIPFPIYAGSRQWVPPLWGDLSMQLNRRKHPYYEHSEADFFIAVKDGADAGRIAVLENKPYNKYHDRKTATFFLFETVEDPQVVGALFEKAFAWARERGLTGMLGPKGFGPLDGYGMLVDGFDHRQTMMMSAYNHAYYPRFLEALGFRKEVDFISCYLPRIAVTLPDRLHRVAEKVLKRGTFSVLNFKSNKEMMEWVPKFIAVYNRTFVNNWEYYPLSDHEVNFVVDNIFQLIHHDLIKIITHKGDIVGFILAFPDVSAALQRVRGYIPPFSFLDPLAPGARGHSPGSEPHRLDRAQRRRHSSGIQGVGRKRPALYGNGEDGEQPPPAVQARRVVPGGGDRQRDARRPDQHGRNALQESQGVFPGNLIARPFMRKMSVEKPAGPRVVRTLRTRSR
jgi:hypothetical protein